MTTPRIPKGWRKLRKGEVIKSDDKFFETGRWYFTNYQGSKVGDFPNQGLPYIRRSSKPKRKKVGDHEVAWQMKIACDFCGCRITKPAALLFGPPLHKQCTKDHICIRCYRWIEDQWEKLAKYKTKP